VRDGFAVFLELDNAQNWPNDSNTARKILRSRGVELPNEVLDNLYEEAARRRKRREREATQGHLAFSGMGSLMEQFNALGLSAMPRTSGMLMPPLRPTPSPYLPPLSREALEDNVEAREAELAIVRTALARVAVLPHFKSGLAFLGVYALISIVLPVSLLATGDTYRGPGWRYTVLGLFVGGLVGLFVYLGVLLRAPTEHVREPEARSVHPNGEPRPSVD
jgi:hypothetical protein